jgi:hypothetical protein
MIDQLLWSVWANTSWAVWVVERGTHKALFTCPIMP